MQTRVKLLAVLNKVLGQWPRAIAAIVLLAIAAAAASVILFFFTLFVYAVNAFLTSISLLFS